MSMFGQVLGRIASVIETMTVDDTTVAERLYYDRKADPEADTIRKDMFRRFAFGYPRTAEADWKHGDQYPAPTDWVIEVPVVIFYPTGGDKESNGEIIAGLALDDATRLASHLALASLPYFNAHPVTDFELEGIQAEHNGIQAATDGLVSAFTLRVRCRRDFN